MVGYRRNFLPGGTIKSNFTWKLMDVGLRDAQPDLRVTPAPIGDTGFTRKDRRQRAVWQPRYWEHRIRDDKDFERHVDYIHWNPVKHGHVMRAVDWPHSSIHRHIRDGLLPMDWGVREVAGKFGE